MTEHKKSKFQKLNFKIMQISILLAVIFVPLVQFLFYLFFFIALISWVFSLFYRKKFFQEVKEIPLFKPFFCLFILGCLSFFLGDDLGSAFGGWGKIFQAFLSYIILYEALTNFKVTKNALIGVNFALLITSVYGILGFYLRWAGQTRRITSFFDSPNPLAIYLLLISLLALGFVFSKNFSLIWRIMALISFASASWALILTMTRGAWLALPPGILVFALVMGLKKRRHLVSVILILLVLVGTFWIGLEYQWLPDQVSRRLDGMLEIDSGRERIWSGSWNMIKDNPLLGVGAGNFPEAFPQYGEGRAHPHAHNLFIHFAAELGLLGVLTLLWFIFELGRRLFPFLSRDFSYFPILAGVLGAFASFFVHTLTHLSIYDRGIALVLIFVISIAVFISDQPKEQEGAK